MKHKGFFLTVEGPEGSGKSSLVKELEKWFYKKSGEQPISTKEPGSPLNQACTEIREMVLSPDNDIDEQAEVFLMMADRCNHVNKVITPALEGGRAVICDRYIDSSFSYQGWGRRHGTPSALAFINYLNEKSTNGLIPDLTIVVFVDVEVGLARATKTEFGGSDRFEKEKMEFHQRVYDGYEHLIKHSPSRNFLIIDSTNRTQEKVAEDVIEYLESLDILH